MMNRVEQINLENMNLAMRQEIADLRTKISAAVIIPESLGKPRNGQGITLETTLCLATLYANGERLESVTLEAADDYYNALPDDCSSCPYFGKCLACKINE